MLAIIVKITFHLNVFWEIVPHSHFIGHLKLTKCKWWRLFGARKWSTAFNSINCKNRSLKYDTDMARILSFNGDKDADICDSKEKKKSYVLFSDDIKWVNRLAETNFSQWSICYQCNLVQAYMYYICNKQDKEFATTSSFIHRGKQEVKDVVSNDSQSI